MCKKIHLILASVFAVLGIDSSQASPELSIDAAVIYPVRLYNGNEACTLNNFLDIYWLCKPQTKIINADHPSPTPSEFIKSTQFRSRITYLFKCSASLPLTADIEQSDRASLVTVASGANASPKTLPVTSVPYAGSAISVSIAAASPNVMIKADSCYFDVLDNVTLPDMPSLQWYLKQLADSANHSISIKSNAKKAAEVPGGWSYVKQIPALLKQQSDSLNIGLIDLTNERDALQTRKHSGDSLSSSEQDRLDLLASGGGPIAVKQAMIASLTTQLPKIKAALEITAPCEASAAAECIAVVGSVVNALDASVNDVRLRLQELDHFAKAEALRIGQSDAKTSFALSQLIEQIATSNNQLHQ